MTTPALYILYVVLAVGAAAVFLLLPAAGERRRSWRWAGITVGLAAAAALVAYWIRWIPAPFRGETFFAIFALLAVAAAVRVVTHPRPVYCAIYFVGVVLCVTALCLLGAAEFLGIALVIVYGGAIVVTYVFVIMLAQQGGDAPYDRESREPLAAVTLGFFLAAAVTQAMATGDLVGQARLLDDDALIVPVAEGTPPTGDAPAAPPTGDGAWVDPMAMNGEQGNVRAVGATLITRYLLAVEVAGLLLLIAMIGAVALARKPIEPDALTDEERDAYRMNDDELRRRGREAAPF